MPDLLHDHFYKIKSLIHTGTEISVQIVFEASHPIFQGHFPDMPIVPGVCQTQILGEILGRVHQEDFSLQSAATIKFLSPIDPTMHQSIDLLINTIGKDDGSYSVSAQYHWKETTFFKFKGTYTAAK